MVYEYDYYTFTFTDFKTTIIDASWSYSLNSTITSILKTTTTNYATTTYVSSLNTVTFIKKDTMTAVNTYINEETTVLLFYPIETMTFSQSLISFRTQGVTNGYFPPSEVFVETYIGVDSLLQTYSFVQGTNIVSEGFTTFLTLTATHTSAWTETYVNWVMSRVFTDVETKIPTILSTYIENDGGLIRYADPKLVNQTVIVPSLTSTYSLTGLWAPINPNIVHPTPVPSSTPIPPPTRTPLPSMTAIRTPVTPFNTPMPSNDYRMEFTYAPSLTEIHTTAVVQYFLSTITSFASTVTQLYVETTMIKSTWTNLAENGYRTYTNALVKTYTIAQFDFTNTQKTTIYYPADVLMETDLETYVIEYTGIEKFISPHYITAESLTEATLYCTSRIYIPQEVIINTPGPFEFITLQQSSTYTFTDIETYYGSLRTFMNVDTYVPSNYSTYISNATALTIYVAIDIPGYYVTEVYENVQTLTGFYIPLPTATFAPTVDYKTPKPTTDPIRTFTYVQSLIEQEAFVGITIFESTSTSVPSTNTMIWSPTIVQKFTWTDNDLYSSTGRTYVYTNVSTFTQTITSFDKETQTVLIVPLSSSTITLTDVRTSILTSYVAFKAVEDSTVIASPTEKRMYTSTVDYPLFETELLYGLKYECVSFVPVQTVTYTSIVFDYRFIRTRMSTTYSSPYNTTFIATTNGLTSIYTARLTYTNTYSEYTTFITTSTSIYVPLPTNTLLPTATRSPSPTEPPRTPDAEKEFLSITSTSTIIEIEVPVVTETTVEQLVEVKSELIFLEEVIVYDRYGRKSISISTSSTTIMTSIFTYCVVSTTIQSLIQSVTVVNVFVLTDIPTPIPNGLTAGQIAAISSGTCAAVILISAIMVTFYFRNKANYIFEDDPFNEYDVEESDDVFKNKYNRNALNDIIYNLNDQDINDDKIDSASL